MIDSCQSVHAVGQLPLVFGDRDGVLFDNQFTLVNYVNLKLGITLQLVYDDYADAITAVLVDVYFELLL